MYLKIKHLKCSLLFAFFISRRIYFWIKMDMWNWYDGNISFCILFEFHSFLFPLLYCLIRFLVTISFYVIRGEWYFRQLWNIIRGIIAKYHYSSYYYLIQIRYCRHVFVIFRWILVSPKELDLEERHGHFVEHRSMLLQKLFLTR